jgi:hypothetical protein
MAGGGSTTNGKTIRFRGMSLDSRGLSAVNTWRARLA